VNGLNGIVKITCPDGKKLTLVKSLKKNLRKKFTLITMQMLPQSVNSLLEAEKNINHLL